MKINTITCHNVYNVGASLQAYALLTYLKNLGHQVEIIDYQPGYLADRHKLLYVGNGKYRKNLLLKCAYLACKMPQRLSSLSIKNVFDKFHKENYTLTTNMYRTNDDLKLNLPLADVYFAGSDQIWNTIFENGKDPAFYLDFAPKESIKSSYAASFATESLDYKYKDEVSNWLNNLDNIAVREKTGGKILDDIGITNYECVVDPVFLLDNYFWKKKCKNISYEEKYLLVYDFDNNYKVEKISKYIAKKYNLKIWSVFKSKYADKQLKNVGPIEFITYIKNANIVLSNSFHATAFSIIFNKDFYVINRNENINTRMRDLLDSYGILDRIVNNIKDVESSKYIDYRLIAPILENEITKSKKYIDSVLEQSEKGRDCVG
ncbi:hypothetical protein TPDSL_09880 [Terrisporobacter petrolearius]|uniref:polysaccharide pyruvyl transferase family protein n=1 Tax=Terrisporobacter petrolearius TaxID=1460447 RepID=UPI00336671BF